MRDPLKLILIVSAIATAALFLSIDSTPSGLDTDLEVGRPQAVLGRLGQDIRREGKTRDTDLVRSRIGEVGSPVREAMARKLYIDFALIATYALFFVSAGRLLMRNVDGWPRMIGIAVVMFGVLGASADTAENITALRVLDLAPRAITVEGLQKVGQSNLLKWAALSMGMFNLGAGFLFSQYYGRRRRAAPVLRKPEA